MKYEKWNMWLNLKEKYHYVIDVCDICLLSFDTDIKDKEYMDLVERMVNNCDFS